jgi:hypothetical protein
LVRAVIPSGHFRVRRISGLLPPFGVTKRIDGRQGCTYLFGVAVGRFAVVGRRFIYRRWPIVDEVEPDGDRFVGRGRLFGVFTFCRFRLEPIQGGPRPRRR